MLNLYMLLHPFSIAYKCHCADPTMKYKQACTKKQEGTAMHRVKVKAISQNARVGMLA